MSKRIWLKFRDDKLENNLWFFLKEQSKLIGARSYLKELLYDDMLNKTDNPTKDSMSNKRDNPTKHSTLNKRGNTTRHSMLEDEYEDG